MNANDISIFDLSPPEKLQLVEDLWDDLTATPSEIPVHKWQKEELARRKANLMSWINPARASFILPTGTGSSFEKCWSKARPSLTL